MAATHFYGSEFFGGEFFFGSTPIVVIDTHDGGRRRRRDEEFRQARIRLREQIRLAIDGPDADILAPALETVAAKGSQPLEERVDISQLVAQVELLKAVERAAFARYRQEIDDDDEDVLLLI